MDFEQFLALLPWGEWGGGGCKLVFVTNTCCTSHLGTEDFLFTVPQENVPVFYSSCCPFPYAPNNTLCLSKHHAWCHVFPCLCTQHVFSIALYLVSYPVLYVVLSLVPYPVVYFVLYPSGSVIQQHIKAGVRKSSGSAHAECASVHWAVALGPVVVLAVVLVAVLLLVQVIAAVVVPLVAKPTSLILFLWKMSLMHVQLLSRPGTGGSPCVITTEMFQGEGE